MLTRLDVFSGHRENQDMTKHQNGRVRLTVNYGYDIHSVEVSASTWQQIQGGDAVTVQGQGFFIEGVESQDVWTFNSPEAGALAVEADDGHQIFIGHMSAASIQKI